MLRKIANVEELLAQAMELKKKRFKPGFDGMTAGAAIMWLKINGEQLTRRLLRGAYDPMPAVGFRSAKRNGGYRQLAKLSAIDMIVQNTIISVVAPMCEERFSRYTYAYLRGRGVTAALGQYCKFGAQYAYAAMLDPTGCFDNVDHDILEVQLTELLGDPAMVSLIMRFVKMPVVVDNEICYPEKGILQGAPISNLLCNIYFSSLDRYLEEEHIPFIRYADDIVLFADSADEAADRHQRGTRYMEEKLALSANSKKCKVLPVEKQEFLGHRFEKSRYGLCALERGSTGSDICRDWHESLPKDDHRRVDILSDGILRQKDLSIVFDDDDRDHPIPVLATDTINVYSSVVFDTGVLRRAMEHDIGINVFSDKGELIGRFVPNTLTRSPQVGHQQLLAYYNEKERLDLARKFVLASIHNCRLNIRYYNKQRSDARYGHALEVIDALEKDIKNCRAYSSLLMLEARVRENYYACFDLFISGKGFVFGARSRKPPRNEVNAMLSFGNVVLYNYIATQINKTPLDIRIGYLHATNRRAESLDLDIAEGYKPLIVDRTVFSLINLKSIRPDHFVQEPNGGVYLDAEGKRLFLEAFYSKLGSKLTVKGQSLSYAQIITEDIRALTRHFRSGEKYTPFKQVK